MRQAFPSSAITATRLPYSASRHLELLPSRGQNSSLHLPYCKLFSQPSPSRTMARLGKRRGSFVASDHSGDERPTKAAKADNKKAAPTSGQADVDADGNTFWEVR